MVLVVFATEMEAGPFLEGADWTRLRAGHKALYALNPNPSSLNVLIAGMGQVNTAQALAACLERSLPKCVIMGGCAGAFMGSGLSIGDVCFATEEIYADTGIYSPEGFMGIEASGIPLAEAGGKKYFNRFPVNDVSTKLAGASFPFKISSGPFATVSAVTGTASAANEMEKRWSAVCENMEGAAAAHVSFLYGVPFIEARGISNLVEDRDRAKWDIALACVNGAAVIKELVERL